MKIAMIVGAFVCAGVVCGGSFFGGMQYEKGHSPKGTVAGAFSVSGNGRFTGSAGMRGRNGLMGAGFVSGDVLSVDDQSVTVKLPEGGSKIIYFSDTTQITKSAAGTSSDLSVGTPILSNGTANADGTITAQSIQIRPPMAVTFTAPTETK